MTLTNHKTLAEMIKEYPEYGAASGSAWGAEDTFIDEPYEPRDPYDPVYCPAHYVSGGIETIDYIEAKLGGYGTYAFCLGNVLKYVSRAGKKDVGKEVQDLEKAAWYLKRAIDYAAL